MNKPRSQSNESDHEDSMTKKDLKELKSLSIPIMCSFLFDSSIIGTLSVVYLKQFYVG